jgi:hypothetical protein
MDFSMALFLVAVLALALGVRYISGPEGPE